MITMAAIKEAHQPKPGEVVPFWDPLEPGEIRNYRPLQFQASVHQNGVPGIQMFKMQPCWNNPNQSQNLQEAAVMRQDEKIKTLQGLLIDLKNTLTKERDEFTAKFSRQSRKIRDCETKDKYQQNEIKEQKKARDMAENMWKKTDEEKVALNAMMQSLEKEGCKINRLLQKKEAELSKSEHKVDVLKSDNEALRKDKLETENLHEEKVLFQAKCIELEEQLRYKELNIEVIDGLEEKITHFKSAYQKTAKSLKNASKETELWKNKLKEANKETELWKNKFKEANNEKECAEKEKKSMGERAEKDKEVLTQKIKSLKNKCSRREKVIQTEKAAKVELQESIETLQKELAILKREKSLLKEENYNLRYYGGFMGGFRRIKRFFVRIADRLLS